MSLDKIRTKYLKTEKANVLKQRRAAKARAGNQQEQNEMQPANLENFVISKMQKMKEKTIEKLA